MTKSSWMFLLKSFLVWRLFIFIPIFLSPHFFELQKNFLGGGLMHYLTNPYFWSWANFDGEHYINIARLGYGNGEQAFFPLYPYLIKFISDVYGFKSPGLMVATGIFISTVAFFVGLVGFYKLVRIDFSEKITKTAIVLLLVFPTSFYFGGVYTESLFFSLIVWAFYFLRIQSYLLAAVFGMLAGSARVVGVVLLPVFFISLIYWKRSFRVLSTLLLIPVGTLLYMYYSLIKWDDPIKFFHAAAGFGEQRSDHLIILPQVFYRYFIKIIPNISWNYFPVIFTTVLEISTAILFLGLILYLFFHLLRDTKVVKSSYWLYMVFAYLIPTLSGSFSSLPRYVLVLFPAFMYSAYFIHKLPKYVIIGIYLGLSLIAVVAQMLFVRGYFVS